MPTGNAKFEAAANEAFCAMLLAAGGAAVSAQVYSWLGGPAVGGTAAVVAGVSGLAYAYSCADWTQPTPTGNDALQGCKSVAAGCDLEVYFESHLAPGTGLINRVPRNFRESISVERTETPSAGDPNEFTLRVFDPYGTEYTFEQTPANEKPISQPIDATLCPCQDSFDPDPVYPPFPDLPPHTYTDPDDGCQINVTFEGFIQGSDYNLSPVFKMDPVLPAARTGGGIIGGCNFTPVVYVQPPGGGGPPLPPAPIPPVLPTPPEGLPWWWPLATGALGGIVGDLIGDQIQKLFESPVPQYSYKMRAACNYKEDGSYEDYTITLPEQPWETRVLAMQEMQLDFLQQHLLWKTPTCSGGGQSVSGEPVTVNFRSLAYTPTGNNVARKRFVYFDQTNSPQEVHVDHWKDFVWEAGPVWVGLKGTPLGTCQVWAADLVEGKRVITHAAQVAGVDVNDGEWISGTSRDPRYGVAVEMHTAKHSEGHYLVTKRSGPNGNPFV